MDPNAPLKLKIASPCPARWSEMTGDERKRFCASCQKHVYNLGAMRVAEVKSLIQETEGKVCIRMYQRSDGTVMTADCPVGLRRVRRTAGMALTLMVGIFIIPAVFVTQRASGSSSTLHEVSRIARRLPVIGNVIELLDPEPVAGALTY